MTSPNPQEGGKHTPGPWSFDYGTVPPDGPGTYADIYVDGGDTIIAHFNNQIVEGLANARLIAAAPAMLEALTKVSMSAVIIPGMPSEAALSVEVLKEVVTALALATGGEDGR